MSATQLAIVGDWLVEHGEHCNCAGVEIGDGMVQHEPGCGDEPIMSVTELARQITVTVCPACGATAGYIAEADRFYHQDGTENRACWLLIIRGDGDLPTA